MTAAEGGADRGAYAAAGVDVEAGDRAVALLRGSIAGAGAAGADLLGGLAGVGAFAAALALPAGMREPVVLSATDGVGTKTEIARALGRRDTIGQDLVAMCVDDLVCHGARPWFFLDYLAVGRVVPEHVAELVGGIARGCAVAGCTLVGGETAEHRALMADDAFDLAGFAVGLAERERLLDGAAVRSGDVIVGLGSSGFHANGYTLVRGVLAGEDLAAPFREVVRRVLGAAAATDLEGADRTDTLGEVLLRPTRIHAPAVLGVREAVEGHGRGVVGAAHITGGGLPGNVPRALPPALGARLDPSAWRPPVEMRLVAHLADIGEAEVRATFNAGIGMAIVLDPAAVESALAWLAGAGHAARVVGAVEPARDTGRYREAGA